MGTPSPADFAELARSGRRPGPGRAFARALIATRDALVGWLVAAGVTPNAISLAGFTASLGAGACYALGGLDASPTDPFPANGVPLSWWPFAGSCGLVVAGFLDVLDGAVARRTGSVTAFGGVLDSALDRFSDLATWLGIVIACLAGGEHLLAVLAVIALSHGYQIAYLRSRAEVVVAHAPVGFWQRSERIFALGFAASFGHLGAAIIAMAVLPAFTVIRRMRHVAALLDGRPEPEPTGPLRALALWRHPRGSIGYDVVAALVLLALLAGPWIMEAIR